VFRSVLEALQVLKMEGALVEPLQRAEEPLEAFQGALNDQTTQLQAMIREELLSHARKLEEAMAAHCFSVAPAKLLERECPQPLAVIPERCFAVTVLQKPRCESPACVGEINAGAVISPGLTRQIDLDALNAERLQEALDTFQRQIRNKNKPFGPTVHGKTQEFTDPEAQAVQASVNSLGQHISNDVRLLRENSQKAMQAGCAKEELAIREVMGWIASDTESDARSKMSAIGHQANLSFLEKLARSGGFHLFCACMNLSNAAAIGVETNLSAIHAMEGGAGDAYSNVLFRILDLAFLIWFTCELLLHVAVQRREFVFGRDWRWNLFDTLIVAMGISEQLFQSMDFTFIRVLRLFRLLRLIRFVRVCRSLRLMIISIAGSVIDLIWAFALMSLISFLFSLFVLQLITTWVQENTELANREAEPLPLGTLLGMEYDGSSMREILNTHYGSVGRSMFTLYIATSGGADWGALAGPLAHVWEFLPMIFGLYVAFLTVGVLNVVTGLFVQSATKAAEEDSDTAIQMQLEDQDSTLNSLREVFLASDLDQNGLLSAEEFATHIQDKNVKAYLACLDIAVSEASGLFSLLDTDESGVVSVDEFLTGCLQLKGKNGMDMANIMYANNKMMKAIHIYSKKHQDFSTWAMSAITGIHEKLHMPEKSYEPLTASRDLT